VKLLLFDVDQTLVSTGGAGIRALNRAFHDIFSMEDAMNGILPHGKTDPGIIREIFAARAPETNGYSVEKILDAYVAHLRQEVELSSTYCVLPGVTRLLDQLWNRPNVLLGLATGNVEKGARIKLERGSLNRYFAFGGFGSDSEERAVLVRRAAELAALRCGTVVPPEDVFVIGDTPLDIGAGRAAGFQTIGVATGKFTTDELAAAGATLSLRDFEVDDDQFFRATRIE
jgi:phosphoglycolate phosphatase-like HAD superfamily hydrolase